MQFQPFPARLSHLAYGVTAYAWASFVLRDNAMDFTSEFVPLLPLGSQATIAWMQGDTVMMDFTGGVYLSSPQLVRITGIPRDVFAAAAPLFAQNTRFACRVACAPDGPADTGEVLYLSPGRITLLCGFKATCGQALWLGAEIDFLTLRRLRLIVTRQYPLRRGQYLTVCDVPPASNDNFIALNAYSARLETLADAGLA